MDYENVVQEKDLAHALTILESLKECPSSEIFTAVEVALERTR